MRKWATETDPQIRQTLEKNHYDRFYRRNETFLSGEVDFRAARYPERRPHDPYWRVFSLLKENGPRGKVVLDCGCGSGYYSVLLASMGATVHGIDISRAGIEIARKRADLHGFGDRAFFCVSTVEELPFGGERFDYILGVDILHHVHIGKAVPQLRSALKKGGMAVFKEWKTALLFDRLRNSSWGLRLFPKAPSTKAAVDLTETERKLTGGDLSLIQDCFRRSTLFYSYFFMRLTRIFRGAANTERLLKLDHLLAHQTTFMSKFGGEVILLLEK